MFTKEENELINMMRELLGVHIDEHEALEAWEDLVVKLLVNGDEDTVLTWDSSF